MRPRTLLGLLVVVAGLAAFIWFFERDLPSTDERAGLEKKLLAVEPDSIEALLLVAGERRVRLERSGDEGEWRLTEPLAGRADGDKVEEFLNLIGDLEKLRTLEGVSAEELGLKNPRASVEIAMPERRATLSLGDAVPASGNTVAALDQGPPFYVVPDVLFEEINREPDAWRSRDAIPVERSRIERVAIVSPGPGLAIERFDGGFRLVEPIVDEADEDRVRELLDELVGLEVEEFVDEPGVEFEFDSAISALEITVASRPQPIAVALVAPVGLGPPMERESPDSASRYSVRVDDEIFLVETHLPTLLEAPVDAWRSPMWTQIAVFEIEGLEIERAGQVERFERSEGKWMAKDVEIDYSAVSDFLYALTGARGTPSDERGADPGVDPGEIPAALEITLRTTEREERLRLHSMGESHLAWREGRAPRLLLETSSVQALMEKLEALLAVSPSDGGDSPLATNPGE